MIDPLAAMQAACIAIANGEANEIELEWTHPIELDALGEREERLTITVRREIKHFFPGPPPPEDKP